MRRWVFVTIGIWAVCSILGVIFQPPFWPLLWIASWWLLWGAVYWKYLQERAEKVRQQLDAELARVRAILDAGWARVVEAEESREVVLERLTRSDNKHEADVARRRLAELRAKKGN